MQVYTPNTFSIFFYVSFLLMILLLSQGVYSKKNPITRYSMYRILMYGNVSRKKYSHLL